MASPRVRIRGKCGRRVTGVWGYGARVEGLVGGEGLGRQAGGLEVGC